MSAEQKRANLNSNPPNGGLSTKYVRTNVFILSHQESSCPKLMSGARSELERPNMGYPLAERNPSENAGEAPHSIWLLV